MPHRRLKPSFVLGAVAALTVTSTVAVYSGNGPSGISSTSETTEISTDIAEVVLAQIPDVVIPLKELTGLDLPDVNIGELRNLPIPPSIQIPSTLELPGGVQIPLKIPVMGDVSDPATPPPADHEPGTIVKEVTRDTPFSMVALTSETVGAAESKIRAKKPDGTWGEWFSPEIADTDSARLEATGGKVATEAVYVGQTNAIQVLTPTSATALPEAP
ncbi:cold-shock protein, partial [Rhodococcus sp. NPDC049939]